MKIGLALGPVECIHGFTQIWPNDLVLGSTWPIFNWDLAFIEINILTQFHEDWIKTEPSALAGSVQVKCSV